MLKKDNFTLEKNKNKIQSKYMCMNKQSKDKYKKLRKKHASNVLGKN